jgi:hypothetical protein
MWGKAMKQTRHGEARANQRGYTVELLDILRTFGGWMGDRQSLNCDAIDRLVAEVDVLRRRLLKLRDKGGGTAVFTRDDRLITVFSPRTYRRRSRHTSAWHEEWA